MLTFWLTLSQYLTEKRNEMVLSSMSNEESGLRADLDSTLDLATKKRNMIKKNVINWIQILFIKTWILLSSGMLLVMSLQDPVVVIRIGYMIFFLYFISAFQVNKIFV